MRQAGRCLPEYRALKEKHSFVELVRTPELAAEVTLQPIRRFDFDGAVLFSDILVIPEAMGQPYHFRETGGIEMDFAVRSADDVRRLDSSHVAERLGYVADALALIKPALNQRTALLGFVGSPWTLANYMVEGAGGHEPARTKEMFYCEQRLFHELLEKLTAAVIEFVRLQISSGVDALQIFDSSGGLLADNVFDAASGRWMRDIVRAIDGAVPVIVFSRGTHGNWGSLVSTGANVLSVDWTQPLAEVRALLPKNVGVQGNLDPALLTTTPEIVARETARILSDMAGLRGTHLQPRPRRAANGKAGLHPGARRYRAKLPMSALQVDLDLVKKYNVAGPRYTSFPPATKFTDTIAWEEVSALIEANNRTARDLSIYFHIPFCETLCWFCGCTTVITLNHDKGRDYIDYLGARSCQAQADAQPGPKSGATPLRRRLAHVSAARRNPQARRHHSRTLQFAPDIEASVEVDPRRLTRDHVVALRDIGFNRASMGVQDFNPAVQQAVHRIQPREMTQQAMDWMRELGFGSINLDLIYGLPHQTPESFDDTLEIVLGMEPDRLAVFSYAHVPWIKPAQKILEQKVLPTPETKLQLLKLVIEKLTANGRYVYIGMDHFARPDDELAVAQRNKQLQRNFQGYSTRAGSDIYAFGMSARLANARCLLAERKGTAEVSGRRGRWKRADAQGLHREQRGQNSTRNHHARHVRSLA